MTKIILVVLFISQLLCFYFILLLNSKISKFKLIEKNQEKLVSEMEDTFNVYLLEMKEENDRLIREMSMVKNKQRDDNLKVDVEDSLETNLNNVSDIEDLQRNMFNFQQNKTSEDNMAQSKVEPIKVTPKSVAANAYKKNVTPPKNAKISTSINEQPIEATDEKVHTFDSEVIEYYKNGMSVEEIAKKTQKGKTEIELLIKFHA